MSLETCLLASRPQMGKAPEGRKGSGDMPAAGRRALWLSGWSVGAGATLAGFKPQRCYIRGK